VLALRAATAEAALQAAERASAALGGVATIDHAARYLPSAATQRARVAALPDEATLAARLAAAREGLPFRPTAFDPFLRDIAAARTPLPLAPADLAAAPLLAARIAPLLRQEADGWRALLLPSGIHDMAALRAAAARIPDLLLVDIKGETEALLAANTGTALRWGAAWRAARASRSRSVARCWSPSPRWRRWARRSPSST
jgi:predicted exporter